MREECESKNNAFVLIIRKREEQVYIFTIVFNIEEGMI